MGVLGPGGGMRASDKGLGPSERGRDRPGVVDVTLFVPSTAFR